MWHACLLVQYSLAIVIFFVYLSHPITKFMHVIFYVILTSLSAKYFSQRTLFCFSFCCFSTASQELFPHKITGVAILFLVPYNTEYEKNPTFLLGYLEKNSENFENEVKRNKVSDRQI